MREAVIMSVIALSAIYGYDYFFAMSWSQRNA
jgi:hypothetical protein